MVYKTKLILLFIKSFLLILLNSNNIFCSDDVNETLLFVLELFSNGLTTSIITNDKNQDVLGEIWLYNQELSNIGFRQQYLLGINDKNKYENFINPYFNPKEILIKSLNISNNIQSAYAHLHGIYPPPNGQKLNNNFSNSFFLNYKNLNENDQKEINNKINNLNLNYSAIEKGINLVPVNIFDFELNNNNKCPNYVQLKKNNIEKNKEKFKSIIYNNFMKRFGDIFLKTFNKNDSFFQNPDNLILFLKTFIIDYLINGNIKSLENENFNFTQFYEFAVDSMAKYTLNIEFDYDNNEEENLISIITSSPILNSLFYYSDLRIDYHKNHKTKKLDSERPKFVLYSVDNDTLIAIKSLLNFTFNIDFENNFDFSSSINFEVYNKDESYKINISYDGEIMENIDYEEFKNISKYLWNESKIKNFCKEKDKNKVFDKKQFNFNIIWTIWSIIAIILIILFINNRLYVNYSNKNN